MTRPIYRPGDDVGPLEDWPFEGAASNYAVVRGAPRASGRLDIGTSTSAHRMGVWRCTEGAVTCTERGDELQTILSGRLRLVREDGRTDTFGPGDSFFTRKGERVTWDIMETVTKVFFTFDRDGRDDA